MRNVIVVAVSALALAAATVASAGNPSLCVRNGWTTAQSGSGGTFTSIQDCARAREVFRPTLTIEPAHVTANELFTVQGAGFHESASATLYFAVTGYEPYFVATDIPVNADGTASFFVVFNGCGIAPPYDLTLTLVDSYGVHASAQMALC